MNTRLIVAFLLLVLCAPVQAASLSRTLDEAEALETPDGRQLVSPEWIEASWQPRTTSRFTGDAYGYGWFQRPIGGRTVHHAWGYGGQMIYIVPSLELTVVMTSDTDSPAGRSGHRDRLHDLTRRIIEATETDAEAAG